MIRCTQNGRYYGESQNVSGRLASHRSLNRQIHPIICCKLTITNMKSTVLSIVLSWDQSGTIHYSKGKELELIIQDRDLCYNMKLT
jgi:hypothetical protein